MVVQARGLKDLERGVCLLFPERAIVILDASPNRCHAQVVAVRQKIRGNESIGLLTDNQLRPFAVKVLPEGLSHLSMRH
jgi:hypothetical protein